MMVARRNMNSHLHAHVERFGRLRVQRGWGSADWPMKPSRYSASLYYYPVTSGLNIRTSVLPFVRQYPTASQGKEVRPDVRNDVRTSRDLLSHAVVTGLRLSPKGNPMTARIRTITFDCADPYPLSRFWGQVTGYGEDPDNPNHPDDPEALLIAPDGSLRLLFIPVPEHKTVKNRVHLDLSPTDGTRDEEVDRLLRLGATFVADHRTSGDSAWVILADPEGNEFCVERSDTERAAL